MPAPLGRVCGMMNCGSYKNVRFRCMLDINREVFLCDACWSPILGAFAANG